MTVCGGEKELLRCSQSKDEAFSSLQWKTFTTTVLLLCTVYCIYITLPSGGQVAHTRRSSTLSRELKQRKKKVVKAIFHVFISFNMLVFLTDLNHVLPLDFSYWGEFVSLGNQLPVLLPDNALEKPQRDAPNTTVKEEFCAYFELPAVHRSHFRLLADAEGVRLGEFGGLKGVSPSVALLLEHNQRLDILAHLDDHLGRTFNTRPSVCIIGFFYFFSKRRDTRVLPIAFMNSSRFCSKYTFQVPLKSMSASVGLTSCLWLVGLVVGMLGTWNSLLFRPMHGHKGRQNILFFLIFRFLKYVIFYK